MKKHSLFIVTFILGTCIGLCSSIRVPLSIVEDKALSIVEDVPLNQNTRIETGVETLQSDSSAMAIGLPQGYTGQGVLVGVYDTGIDYNHINFRDPATNRTRISMAILYRETEGAADSIREVYTEPACIDTLTTDTHATWHGTHTSGTAAGSYRGMGWQGMAPGATLALCGTSKLKHDRMEDALRSIFAHADELEMPCVINVSIGNCTGWKDGLSPIPQLCEELTDGGEAPGRIIVFSAGNDGSKDFTFEHTFTASDQPVYSMLEAPKDKEGQPQYRNFGIEAYMSDSLPMRISLVAYDTLQHREVDYQLVNLRGDVLTPAMLADTLYYTDSIAPEHDFRRYVCVEVEDTCRMQTTDVEHTVLAVRFDGRRGSTMVGYYVMDSAVGSYALRDGGQPGWLHSDSRHSINEYCCTESVISVGSYSLLDSLVNILGNTVRTETPRHEVADFSSYGTTYYGVDKPDVICPGVFVISSFSTFCEDKISYYTSGRKPDSPLYYCMDATEEEPRPNYWSADKGTSMSSPVMAGIIALWLEACPTLTTNQVRQILRDTSRFDDYCAHCPIDPRQAGFGKVDALAGMDAVLALAGIERVTIDAAPHRQGIFDLYGREFDIPRSQLPRGLYIIDGRKVRI